MITPLAKPRSRADEKAEKKQKADKHKREVYRQVTQRDGYRCRAYGTRIRPDAISLLDKGHHHEIRYLSLGGKITTDNCVLLSSKAHADVHAGRLFISGDANGYLTFEKDGREWQG